MVKALIISSDEGARYLYQVAIAYQRIETEIASTIADGLKKIAQDDVDIVILDIMAPDIKDVNTITELKTRLKSLPLIIMTDMREASQKQEASIFGACQTLIKGEHSLGDLIKTVRKVVKKA